MFQYRGVPTSVLSEIGRTTASILIFEQSWHYLSDFEQLKPTTLRELDKYVSHCLKKKTAKQKGNFRKVKVFVKPEFLAAAKAQRAIGDAPGALATTGNGAAANSTSGNSAPSNSASNSTAGVAQPNTNTTTTTGLPSGENSKEKTKKSKKSREGRLSDSSDDDSESDSENSDSDSSESELN